MQDTHHLAAPPILKVPSHHRVRSPSTIIRSETGSVVWAGNVTPNPEAGGNPKTAKLNGIQNSVQSRASWDRIQYLMKRDRRTRCPSGITDYGTETSYFEGGGRAQQRTSMLSTIAMAVGGYGNSSVPPVPPISVHYLTNQNQSDATLSHYIEPAPMRDITNDKMDKMTARNFAASTHSPETTTPSNGVLPLQYQSSKLFPAVEWETGDTIIRGSDTASPVASDMKHSRSSSYSVGQSSSSLTSLGGDRQAESDNKHGIGHRPPLAPFSHMQIRRASVQAESIRTPFRK